MKSRGLIFCTLLLALALPALSLERPNEYIPAGVDYWQTLSGGATAYDFSSDPIPAGFFCKNSRPFTGRVSFEGVPLQTAPAGILGTTDTVIERLDDAYFDHTGTAKVRIRGRALNLQGTEPLKTSCGRFKVTAELTENQPESPMVLHRRDESGGTFDAQLRLQVRVNFTNLANGKVSSVVRNVYLPTVDGINYATGTAAVRCQNVSAIDATQVTLADGRPLISRPANSGKVVLQPVEPAPGPFEPAPSPVPVPIVTGCYCQNGVCLYTYSWHDPCANNPNCELHWTHTPCQLGYDRPECDEQAASLADQLEAIAGRGFLTEKPEVVLQKQLRSAEEIKRDQAARDRAERQKQ
jgi:hypothetical protein